ncbi:MAG TPA: amidohydrolase [Kofleriaceae bacterium]|nr:amidohydrolase [Kofleriaceae bacterium]
MAAVMGAGCGGAERGGEEASGADLVLTGGAVMTMDRARPQATAVAIRGDRIVAVGSDREVMGWVGRRTRVIELEGRSVTPGLTDSHAHLAGLGAALEALSLKGAASEEEAAVKAAAAAATLPEGEWLVGRGWDQNLWREKKFPSASTLDHALRGRPVALERIDGHALWVSSKALELAGIDRSTPDPKGGRIVRDEGGQPTGVLIDAATALVEQKIPPPSDAARQRRILAAARLAIESGITCVHEMGIDDATADIYRNLEDERRLPLRIYAFLSGSPQVAGTLPRRVPDADREGNARFILRGVKFFADGALGSRGAVLLAPYSDDPKNSGLWVTPAGELERAIEAAVDGGWQPAVHAIGDAGVRAVLDAYQAVRSQQPKADLRLRIEHAQVVAPEDMTRFAKLGVIASMQPTHATSDMRWAEARLGPDRIRGAYAWRQLVDSGAHVAFGSDFPVEEVSPLLGIYAAVTRQDAAGQPAGGWRPEEKLTLEEAVRAFTSEGAYAGFVEQHRGQIKAGMLADITVYDRKLAADASLLKTRIDMTIVGGEPVYERTTR